MRGHATLRSSSGGTCLSMRGVGKGLELCACWAMASGNLGLEVRLALARIDILTGSAVHVLVTDKVSKVRAARIYKELRSREWLMNTLGAHGASTEYSLGAGQ